MQIYGKLLKLHFLTSAPPRITYRDPTCTAQQGYTPPNLSEAHRSSANYRAKELSSLEPSSPNGKKHHKAEDDPCGSTSSTPATSRAYRVSCIAVDPKEAPGMPIPMHVFPKLTAWASFYSVGRFRTRIATACGPLKRAPEVHETEAICSIA